MRVATSSVVLLDQSCDQGVWRVDLAGGTLIEQRTVKEAGQSGIPAFKNRPKLGVTALQG